MEQISEVKITASLLKHTKGNIAQALILIFLRRKNYGSVTYKAFLREYDPNLWGLFYKNDNAYFRSLRDLRDVKGLLVGGNGEWALSELGKQIEFE